MLLFALEYLVTIAFLTFMITQIMIPLARNTRLCPAFRRRPVATRITALHEQLDVEALKKEAALLERELANSTKPSQETHNTNAPHASGANKEQQ